MFQNYCLYLCHSFSFFNIQSDWQYIKLTECANRGPKTEQIFLVYKLAKPYNNLTTIFR